MEPIYRQTITLTDNHLDRFGRLKASTLLFFIQDIAGSHAERLGSGWEALDRQQLFWALIRHKVQIHRLPQRGETITLETWPMPTTRVAYPRCTLALDAQGKELFRSVAVWILMDKNTRAMVLPGKSGVTVPGILRGGEQAQPQSIPPRALPRQLERTVGYTELDRNGHMNNTRYMEWADDLLSSDYHREHPLREMNLSYISEAREGEPLRLSWELDGEAVLSVEILRPDPADTQKTHRVFAARLQF